MQLSDIHFALSEITKYLSYEDIRLFRIGYGKGDDSDWNWVSLRAKMLRTHMLEDHIANKWQHRLSRNICCVADCEKKCTLVVNIYVFLNIGNEKGRVIYKCIYCNEHFKQYRNIP